MKSILLLYVAFALFIGCAWAEEPAPIDPLAEEVTAPADPAKSAEDVKLASDYVSTGLQAMQDSNTTPERIIDAALSFTAALKIYQDLGDTEKMRDMNANIFWCKKRMNLDDLNTYLAKKGNDKAVADSIEQMNKAADKEIPKDQADQYFARANKFAEENKDQHLLIAIRYFEVAERFQGTTPSLKAQRLSLDAYQQYTKAFAEQQKTKRLDTLFTKSAASAAANRTPVPGAADQKAALANVKKLYKDDYAGTKDAQKKKCAWKLYDQSKSSGDDPVTRFVMLSEAIRLSQSAGDIYGVLTFVDETAQFYSDGYDAVAEKRSLLGKMKAGDAPAAVLKLLDDPANADANTKAGKYFCLQAEQWEMGLAMLSLGADAEWKHLAQMELEKPSAAPQQIELGDLWYEMAGKNKPSKEAIMTRARFWYKQALPSSNGVAKTRIAQRLDEILAIVPDPDFDYTNLTPAQWDKLKGTGCVVASKGSKTDPGVTLAAGQKVRIVPHPTDTWNADVDSRREEYTWRGGDLRIGWFGMGMNRRNDTHFMELGMCLDNGNLQPVGIITGPGKLYLGPDDSLGMAAGGSIRVKIIPVDQ